MKVERTTENHRAWRRGAREKVRAEQPRRDGTGGNQESGTATEKRQQWVSQIKERRLALNARS